MTVCFILIRNSNSTPKVRIKRCCILILKTIEFAEMSERNLKTVITSKPQNPLEELFKIQLLK